MANTLVFFVAFIMAFTITPIAEKIGIKFGAIDIPDERKVHEKAIPRIGGLSLFAAIVISFLSGLFYLKMQRAVILPSTKEIAGIFLGSLVVVMFGFADDFKSLAPREKFLGQIASAIILIIFGTQIYFIKGVGESGVISLGILSAPLTVFWVVALINTINFTDGLDGLAAGVSCIAALTFFIFSLMTGQVLLSLLCMAVVGSTLGFLRHNFYPARIFMGDSGSMLLGFLIAAISIQGAMKSIAIIALYMTVIIVGIPILDTFTAIVRRLSRGRSITQADSDHLHHKLLKKGISHPAAVIIIYIWTAILCAAGLALRFLPSLPLKLLIFAGLFLLSMAIFSYLGLYKDLFLVPYIKLRRKRK